MPTEMDYIAVRADCAGRSLPNGTVIVTHEDSPALLYKFTPWGSAALAFHEIDIYSRLRAAADFQSIVRMEGISSTKDYLIRIMERSHRGPLDRFLLERSEGDFRAVDITLARSWLAQIAQAMADIHALGLVHRDLKAENILVFDADANMPGPDRIKVKLSDFDRAAILPSGRMLDEPVGSLFHMAPELLSGQEYNRKVDVYAFGILVFEVLHGGMRPYSNVSTGMPGALSRSEFCEKVVSDGYRPEWLREEEELKRLAFECWKLDPRERPEFSEIVELLKPLSASEHTFQPGIINDDPVNIGIGSTVGKVRRTMEDAVSFLVTPDVLICGVFDGLKGGRCSEFAARCLPLALSGELADKCQDADTAIQKAFETVQSTLRRMKQPVMCGSTATIAIVRSDDILVAWLGDSPAWIFRMSVEEKGAVAVPLIKPHHPDRSDEAERVVAQGGEVRREQKILDSGEAVPWGPIRVFSPDSGQDYGVAISRCLGLFPFSPAVGGEPETFQFRRQPGDLYLVLGSDGVSEVLAPPRIYEIIEMSKTPQGAANKIIDEVLHLGSPDNASILIVKLFGTENLKEKI